MNVINGIVVGAYLTKSKLRGGSERNFSVSNYRI